MEVRSEGRKAYQREWMRNKRASTPGYRKLEVERTLKWQRKNPAHASWINACRSARTRGYEWGLERAEYDALVLSNCFYCGAEPSPINGVDRVNNDLGYVSSNVVTACAHCNYAKRAMTSAQFINWARRVVAHSGG